MKPLVFASLSEIQAHEFTGCVVGDDAAFTAIEVFAKANPLDAMQALSVMTNKGMGLGDLDEEEFGEWLEVNGVLMPSEP